MIFAHVRANVEQQEANELVAASYIFFMRGTIKTWNEIWKVNVFLI